MATRPSRTTVPVDSSPEVSTMSTASTSTISKSGSHIQTQDGIIHVQPYRQANSKQLRAVISFTPRSSAFEASGSDPFRGFYSLFWISMFLLLLRTYVNNFFQNGYPLSLVFATLFTRDAVTLAISDAVLVCSTFICVPFVQAVQKGYIQYYYTGQILLHLYQTVTLGLAIRWTFDREWPWVQSGFFTLHTLVMLMKTYSYMDTELTSTGKNRVRFPTNLTYANFLDFQMVPTLCYELEYPRTERIRPMYIFEKTVATFGTFTLLYTITEHYIIPLTPTSEQSFWRSMLDLALPFMLSYLILFYIIFECICNGFAELSCFGDREFYQDWWNSTSFDEYARKWNKPVHAFLLRHVYQASLSSKRVSRFSATFLTFLLSALVHELVMAVVTKKIRMYLFVMQMSQIPLIFLGRLPFIRRNKVLGNVLFWVGLMAGFPLLCVAYCAY
ncbi:hypothetical protein FS749_012584 [Ceratobasidium sp. UAMH 11750]|nr:hypothetical protein FS749_012584 [Ceratobasidium sp. UAMH 11750]